MNKIIVLGVLNSFEFRKELVIVVVVQIFLTVFTLISVLLALIISIQLQ